MADSDNLLEKSRNVFPATNNTEIDSGSLTTPRSFTPADIKRAAQKHALSLVWTGTSAHTPTQKNAAANNMGVMEEISFLFKNGYQGMTLGPGAVNTSRLQRVFPNGNSMNRFLARDFRVHEIHFQFYDSIVGETLSSPIPGPGQFTFHIGQYDFGTGNVEVAEVSKIFTTDAVVAGDVGVLIDGNAAGVGSPLLGGVTIAATLTEEPYNTATFSILNLTLRGVYV
jgi:hypothetical protein